MKIKMKMKMKARESSVIGHFHFPVASFDSVYLRVTQFGYKMDAHNAEFGDKKQLDFGCKTISEKVDNRNILWIIKQRKRKNTNWERI